MRKTLIIKHLHNFLLKIIRPRKPVILRFSSKMKYNGSYSYYNKKHYITLNSKDNLTTLKDDLAHEWSHLIQKGKYAKEAHSEEWGKCYAKIFRIYLEWDKQYGRCN